MRPDEHRRKKNENYKRKHNIQGKKSEVRIKMKVGTIALKDMWNRKPIAVIYHKTWGSEQ